jgi:hypothetical protein
MFSSCVVCLLCFVFSVSLAHRTSGRKQTRPRQVILNLNFSSQFVLCCLLSVFSFSHTHDQAIPAPAGSYAEEIATFTNMHCLEYFSPNSQLYFVNFSYTGKITPGYEVEWIAIQTFGAVVGSHGVQIVANGLEYFGFHGTYAIIRSPELVFHQGGFFLRVNAGRYAPEADRCLHTGLWVLKELEKPFVLASRDQILTPGLPHSS